MSDSIYPKNANLPAAPVPNSSYYGLTKREYIATHMLAALAIPAGKYMPSVEDAVRLTDRLLAKLAEPQP